MGGIDFSLYLITDRHQTRGRPLPEVITAALRAGARAIQLREKDLETRPLLDLAQELCTMGQGYGARVLVNERLDVAWAARCAGVHLPAAGLPTAVARRLLGIDGLLGASAHSAEEAEQADAGGADFIVLGPLFQTPAKTAFGPPIGLRELERARARCRAPLFGIGGITKDRIADVLMAGARGVAVIRAVMEAEDVERATRDLLALLEARRESN